MLQASLHGLAESTPPLINVFSCNVAGIYRTVQQCAEISSEAGGIGIAVHKVRARGSYIHSKSGCANGLVPMLRVFNATARLCDQVSSSSYEMHVSSSSYDMHVSSSSYGMHVSSSSYDMHVSSSSYDICVTRGEGSGRERLQSTWSRGMQVSSSSYDMHVSSSSYDMHVSSSSYDMHVSSSSSYDMLGAVACRDL